MNNKLKAVAVVTAIVVVAGSCSVASIYARHQVGGKYCGPGYTYWGR